MQTTRPVFLDLWRIKLPIPGVVSILHRISGVLMVLAIPLAAIFFHQALSGPAGFEQVAGILDFWPVKLILLVLAWSLLHHLFAGIRYLLLDLGLGLDRPAARRSSWAALIAAIVVLVIGGGLAL
ncbi:MAG: succinate dehydrogenase, cytochrome b556 subunit [Thiocapsa sp.]|uniref:succinate dehydrogenase, cytochrome b556 subunit n=1 Tax=Thiocapsa sp. TaxID=2024551 RepID=UPI001BCC44A1|nr:succinate dehydrogenase, cytochrome b556 subunit [Thiocapsa sp.]QVL50576.1 MAG: succinate dehydrogenase, cytochrome b556 subunit [Thiocapsa sp.]